MIKFIFDLDGTITSCETLPFIAKHFNIEAEIARITKETVAGNISFDKSFGFRISILGKLPVNEVSILLENTPLLPKLLKFIQENKEHCIVATSNLDCWIEKLMPRISCKFYSSQGLVENNEVVKLVKILNKEEVCKKYQDLGYYVVFIGDGHNDAEAMKLANISIASGIVHDPAQSVLDIADYTFYHEDDLLQKLNSLRQF